MLSTNVCGFIVDTSNSTNNFICWMKLVLVSLSDQLRFVQIVISIFGVEMQDIQEMKVKISCS